MIESSGLRQYDVGQPGTLPLCLSTRTPCCTLMVCMPRNTLACRIDRHALVIAAHPAPCAPSIYL